MHNDTHQLDDNHESNETDIHVVRKIGVWRNIDGHVNKLITKKGTISKRMAEWKTMDKANLIKSFLAITDGGGNRPLLDNKYGFEIFRGTTFSRGGSAAGKGLTTILIYNGTPVREINTRSSTVRKLNVGSPEETELSRLVTDTLKITSDKANAIADKTGVSEEVVREVISENEYVELTYGMIEMMVREKNKHYKAPKPGER